MKQNIVKGIILISAIALSSCSTQNKIAATNDDVYGSKVTAGEQPVYAAHTTDYRQDNVNNDDYSYYDSYAARLNRFNNYSVFAPSYYDDFYYGGYSPYSSGLSIGLGYGYGGYGYSPFGGYGYSPYGYGYGGYGYNAYNPYGYYGSTYGYGASPYWGAYSYNNVVGNYGKARPFRGTGNPGVPYGNRGTTIGYGAPNSNGVSYTGRPSRVGTTSVNGNYSPQSTARPSRNDAGYVRPQPQPQSYTPPPASNNNSGSNNSGGSSSSGGRSSGGGGGGRPSRP